MTQRKSLKSGLSATFAVAAAMAMCGVGCGGSTPVETKPEPVKIKRRVLSKPGPGDIYGTGCAWVTLKSDAVVCFQSQSVGGQSAVAMIVHATAGGAATKTVLFQDNAAQAGLKKAQAWLDNNPIIAAEVRDPPPLMIAPDKKQAFVTMDGLRYRADGEGFERLGRVLELPDGALVAFFNGDGTKPYFLKKHVGALPSGSTVLVPTARVSKIVAHKPTAALRDPSLAKKTAPPQFLVEFDTTAGKFRAVFTRAWAPNGVDRFYNLVVAGYFNDIAIFRAIKGFMYQFGIHGNPEISAHWRDANIQDDPVNPKIASNTPGTITFAMAGPNTRTTQLFINVANNSRLDKMGFPPIGRVTDGFETLYNVNTEYGEGAPRGKGPGQNLVQQYGNKYLKRSFPRLTWIKSISLVQ